MKRGIVPEDYGRLTRFSSLTRARDGAVAYVKYFWREDAWQRRVCLNQQGKETEISLGGSMEILPAFSADGKILYFLSDGSIAAHDRETGDTRAIPAVPDGFEAVDLLPLLNGFLFVCRQERRETAPEGCDWQMSLVAESLRYRSDADHGFTKKYVYQLCRYDGKTRVLAQGEKPYAALAVLPGEEKALYAQEKFCLLNLENGGVRELAASFRPGGDIRPAVSADGRYAIVAARTEGAETALRRLWLDEQKHPADEIENEPSGLPNGVYMDVSPEKKSWFAPGLERDTFFVVACQDHRPGLWRLTVSPDGLRHEEMSVRGLVTEAAAEQADGVAVLYGHAALPPEPALWREGAVSALCADANSFISTEDISPYLPLSAPSQDGRAELTGYLLMPKSDEGKKCPLLVWVHGGPAGCWSPGFNIEAQFAVSRGYAVLLPNPRGSTGRGNAYADPEHAFDGGAANDVLTLLDAALRQHICLDGGRVGILGGSYGGYMAAWMEGNTDRFQAAVVIKAVTNWLFIHFKSSQAGQPVFDEYRDFQDFLVDTVKQSPVFMAQDVKIPTLIIHGEADQQVPVENAHQYYTALKDCHPDLPVKLLLMPDCCHGYSRDALPDYLLIQRETLDWLDRYVKGC
ncbi:MAG: S9 family peptidase [Clostridia bacterium]|nr:S9 family peptidase [Clostridia bacterium]